MYAVHPPHALGALLGLQGFALHGQALLHILLAPTLEAERPRPGLLGRGGAGGGGVVRYIAVAWVVLLCVLLHQHQAQRLAGQQGKTWFIIELFCEMKENSILFIINPFVTHPKSVM